MRLSGFARKVGFLNVRVYRTRAAMGAAAAADAANAFRSAIDKTLLLTLIELIID